MAILSLSALSMATSCAPLLSLFPPDTLDITIEADVIEADADGLPRALSGTFSGDLTGTYSESVVELFFDGEGNLTAALSVSQYVFDGSQQGSISSFNFVVVNAPILLTDDAGDPVLDDDEQPTVIGLESAATGLLFMGSGDVDEASGEIETTSSLLFGEGAMGLGRATTELRFHLNEPLPIQ